MSTLVFNPIILDLVEIIEIELILERLRILVVEDA